MNTFTLFEDATTVRIRSDDSNSTITFNRSTGLGTINRLAFQDIPTKNAKVQTIYGIYGIISLVHATYIIVVKECKVAAWVPRILSGDPNDLTPNKSHNKKNEKKLNNKTGIFTCSVKNLEDDNFMENIRYSHPVYEIKKVGYVKLKTLNTKANDFEFLNSLEDFFKLPGLYFSEFPIYKSFVDQRYNEIDFLFNCGLADEFSESVRGDCSNFLVNCFQGYISSKIINYGVDYSSNDNVPNKKDHNSCVFGCNKKGNNCNTINSKIFEFEVENTNDNLSFDIKEDEKIQVTSKKNTLNPAEKNISEKLINNKEFNIKKSVSPMTTNQKNISINDRNSENNNKQDSINLNLKSVNKKAVTNISSVYDSNKQCLTVLLISRRSWRRMGMRFFSRGVDNEGYPSNFVETEQIICGENGVISFLQTRGSIPIKWGHNLGIKINPPISMELKKIKNVSPKNPRQQEKNTEIKTNDDFFEIADEVQRLHYGNIFYLNLIQHIKYEKILNDEYKRLLAKNNYNFLCIDFKNSGMGSSIEARKNLIKDLRPVIELHGLSSFNFKDENMTFQEQDGVIRTNCIDCLDRTNIVQSLIGRETMKNQISEYFKYDKILEEYEENHLYDMDDDDDISQNTCKDSNESLNKNVTKTDHQKMIRNSDEKINIIEPEKNTNFNINSLEKINNTKKFEYKETKNKQTAVDIESNLKNEDKEVFKYDLDLLLTKIYNDVDEILKIMYFENGNKISIQYSGTPSLKSSITHKNKQGIIGYLKDGYFTAKRYIKNRFYHGKLTDGYALATFNFNVTKNKKYRYKIGFKSIFMIYVMLIIIIIFSIGHEKYFKSTKVNIILPTLTFGFITFIVAFWNNFIDYPKYINDE